MSTAESAPATATVSVVIPAHRPDAWLDEAVGSVLASREVALELAVVLNGVEEVPERPWMRDARVSVLHSRAPLGPTRAMIRGIEAGRGTYIARLDADDRMDPDRLHTQVSWLQAHPETPLVATATTRIDERGADLGPIRMPTGADVRHHLVLSNTVVHSSVLFRRGELEAIGGYDERLQQMEDYDVILRLAQRGPIAVLPEPLTDYRLHPGQVSRGAAPSGAHIDAVIAQRTRLGRVLGMSRPAVVARNLVWRAAQYSRYHGLTRPGHTY